MRGNRSELAPARKSAFQGSLLMIVMMINGSEKRNCEGGFWASEFACFWKSQSPAPKEYILQWFTQQNHQRDNTHYWIIHLISSLPTTWLLHSWANTHVSLFIPTKHKPIPLTFIRQFLNVFVRFLLILLGYKSQNYLRTLSTSESRIAQSVTKTRR